MYRAFVEKARRETYWSGILLLASACSMSSLSAAQTEPADLQVTPSVVGEATNHISAAPDRLVSTALEFLGITYRFGSSNPDHGLDCSGFVKLVIERVLGIGVPRTAKSISNLGTPVVENELQKGDLLFFNTLGRPFSHVGIYIGDRKFVHASSRARVIRVESLDSSYHRMRYNGARRLPELSS